MSEENVEVVRLPMTVAAQSRRRLDERLAMRLPGFAVFLTRTALRLPSRSRFRQGLVRYLTRQSVEAFNRGDYEAVIGAFYAPDCEFDAGSRLRALGLEGTHGREGRIRFQEQWFRDWGDFRFEPNEVIDLGDGRLMLKGRVRGTGTSSGAAFDDEWAVLLTLAAGQVVRERVFFDHGEALEAAGLSE